MKNRILLLAMAMIMALGVAAQQVTFYTPSIVRITHDAPDTSRDMGLSLVVTAQPAKVKVVRTIRGSQTIYRTSELQVTVDTDAQQVTFADVRGNVLLREGKIQFNPISQGPDAGRYVVGQQFLTENDEPIYGLGLLQNGKMNQRGEHRLMMQSNLDDYAHFFQSIKGYGIYWDNYSPTRIDDDGTAISLQSQVGTKADYYFMYGKNADGVISAMRHLSGQVPMLPLWTYGFHQSRERYKSSRELLDVVNTYRKTQVPFDGIIQDWQYWGSNYLWNSMDFLNEEYFDYQRMIRRVHQQNAHISISIWASFGPETLAFKELKQKGLIYNFETWPQSGVPGWPPRMEYPSGVRCYDPYSQTARDIYWKHLSRLHKAGIDAWWMDSTDPDHHSFQESDLDELQPVTNPATGQDFSTSWRSVRNAFPLCTVQGVYDSQRAVDSTRRVFILTRSYFAGQQRTGANTWSGDVGSSWDSFRKQIPICLNYTLTANPMVNTDLGGFFANAYNRTSMDNTATHNPLFQELYVRWMQFGTFCPMMRSHGTEVYKEIYHYGNPGEPVYDALLSSIRLRYQLLPYIYSHSWQVSKNDDSFMRALMMDFADDSNVWDNNREFMFGRSLLVAPVVQALYTPETANQTNELSGWDRNNRSLYQEGFQANWNATKQYEVYLPKGSDWYDFWTGELLHGGQTIQADGTLAHCPLYVRAGSILPQCKDSVQYANVADWQNLDITVYPGANATFTLYEDEGDNYNYQKGMYSEIPLIWNNSTRTLTIGKRSGQFTGMHTQRTFQLHLPGGSSTTVSYDGTPQRVKL